MRSRSSPRTLVKAVALAAALAASSLALAERPGAAPQDMGATPAATTMTVSIVLKVRDPEALDEFIADTVNPDSGRYHRFLSVQQFRQRFAPSEGQIRRVTQYLQGLGIHVDEIYPSGLIIKATGTAAQFSQAFSTGLRDYDDEQGRRFHRPDSEPRTPDLLQDVVLYVAGLNTQASQFHPRSTNAQTLRARLGQALPAVVLPSGNGTATGVPGSYTTGDVAGFYGVDPLYAQGITGKGMTVGIATLADFVPADAYTYWSRIGLNVKPNRITQVRVDGGGMLSGAAGSGETSLDVEQSGGLAPDADVVVYDAPNTEAGFIDVFYKAVADNKVDTLSVSWGSPEIYNFAIPGISTDSRPVLVAYHQAFAEAAAQGISAFAAAGDSGAYDTNRSLPAPQFSSILTADSPASDPYIVAAGGTTLPGTIQLGRFSAPIPTEQVWGWDYLAPFCSSLGLDNNTCGIYSVGGGGGVSVFWPQPAYQRGVPGIRRSEPNQVWTYYPNYPDTSVQQYLYTVPANVKGRNLPDISLNSDPFTGYLVYSSTDGGWLTGYGGTSFAAPQLNGIFALVAQAKGSRLGLLQPQLYGMRGSQRGEHQGESGNGSSPGVVDVIGGDNWFYSGIPGYEPGAGLGTINAAALVRALPGRRNDD
ncbi:MAG: S8/S53 family peptidase [Burkholderiales bacterium]|nr:S8/S53 family peptidase [Burkholderiales bacterium]